MIPFPRIISLTTLLLGDTDGPATATGGLGVLTTDTETPVVSETTVSADLLEALKILTELGVDTVSKDVRVLAIDDIALSVDEPCRDLVLGGVLEDGDDSLKLFGGELTSAIMLLIDIGLLADQVRVSATDTLDLGQGVHNLLLSVNIGVEKTENLHVVSTCYF
ncbi:hypothetical protein HG531_011707 [Fusarium graminearum]|nr:hypothetical protein HG531_011707 [Fusarium graminearum]